MATKVTKANPLNGTMHTAGIYSDMTVDGPEIGTLVVIVDRAKNLPNRKSIGKQDPYCAARLGKEAKKTETDRRGGQTPKWDQELRFTVRDSPDYYQMKVSVFNDDKKTDLIGETWVNLHEVVVPGGGHNDGWHNLNCKGKYAGELRIEITYYDSRPKQEKAPDNMRQTSTSGAVEGQRESMTGPRQPKPVSKRRPLPPDPTAASPSPTGTPEHAQTQSRGYPAATISTPDYKQTVPRNYQTPPAFSTDHVQTPPRGYQTPSTHIYTQSPLQAVEYNMPSQNFPQVQQEYSASRGSMNAYSAPPVMLPVTPMGRHMQEERYEPYDQLGGYEEFTNGSRRNRYEDYVEGPTGNAQFRFNPHDLPVELPTPTEYGAPSSPDGPPPPPPAHRSNHTSPVVSIPLSDGPYELPQTNAIRNISSRSQQDVYRHSMPATYSQSNSYNTWTPPRTQEAQPAYPDNNDYQEYAPRHLSYDDRFNENYRAMQPTVEDVPSSPAVPYPSCYQDSEAQVSKYDDQRYDHVPPTAPLNLNSRGSAAFGDYNASASSSQLYPASPSTVSALSYNDTSTIGSEISAPSQTSEYNQSHRYQDSDQIVSPGGYVPSLPPTLVAGMDPMIAQEVSERIYTETRASYNRSLAGSSRDRLSEQPQYRHSYPHPHRHQEASVPFVPAAASSAASIPTTQNYDQRQSRSYAPVVKPKAVSPDPRVPPRKSVSPSPIASPDGRRLSGVPFGPDAYDALNPNVSTTAPVALPQSTTQNNVSARLHQLSEPETPAKIIMHDGREIDPSDHLPQTSWAPEPESRGSKKPDSSRGRPTPNSGPRPIRQIARSQAIPLTPTASSPIYPIGGVSEPTTPAATGRNRLQKKTNRNYNTPAPAPQSSPLAPVSAYQDNSFATRSLPRAHTMDFAGENGYGSYGSPKAGNHGVYGRNSMGAAPPIPAKVPINQTLPPYAPTENAWALLEEMKSIDLGSGRARRKNYHAVA